MDGGDELFVYPAELKLKYFVKHAWGQRDDTALYRKWSRIPTIASTRLSQEDYEGKWRRLAKRLETADLKELIQSDVLNALESVTPPPPPPRGWCAKEVGGETDRILETWFALFSEARVLLLLRDPLMITRAILNDRRRKNRHLKIRDIVYETLDSLRVVKAQSRYLRDPRSLTIFYEDLVTDTPREMRRISDFLGISYTQRFAEPTVLGDSVVVATSSRVTTQVFAGDARWSDGLSLRERITVRLTAAIAGLLPKYRLDYRALRERHRG